MLQMADDYLTKPFSLNEFLVMKLRRVREQLSIPLASLIGYLEATTNGLVTGEEKGCISVTVHVLLEEMD